MVSRFNYILLYKYLRIFIELCFEYFYVSGNNRHTSSNHRYFACLLLLFLFFQTYKQYSSHQQIKCIMYMIWYGFNFTIQANKRHHKNH